MKKLSVAITLTVLTAAVIWWRDRTAPLDTAPTAVTAAASPTQPAAQSPGPSTDAPPQVKIWPGVPQSRAGIFGATGPVALADIPAGRFHDELAQLPTTGRSRALSALARLQVPVADIASLHADATGQIFYACDLAPPNTNGEPLPLDPEKAGMDLTPRVKSGREALALFAVSVPVATPPVRHSKPGSANVIYLDFNGHTVTGTVWNIGSGAAAAYECVPYDTDGNTSSFSPAEQSSIVRIWERVAEDYRTFDVDVTTEAPAVYTNQTAHVLITRSNDANGVPNPSSASAGGVAYLGVFGQSNYASSYNIAFVYSNTSDDGWVAVTASHESGHNMGLSHDGSLNADGTKKDEYYSGHGSGPASWSPIMGAGHGNIQQWSKGEYFRANNPQDDLAIIAGKLGTRADDHTNADGTATPLIINGADVQQSGIITNSADTDRFSFTTGAGPVSLAVAANSFALTQNKGSLDAAAELYDSSGTLVTGSDPPESTTATIGATLTAGTYYLRVHNTGAGTPMADPPSGYTAYGSVGEYAISGTIVATAGSVAASIVRNPNSDSEFPGNQAVFSVVARGNPATNYQWQRSIDSGATWQDLAEDAIHSGVTGAVLTVANIASPMNGYRYRCAVANAAGTATSAAATLTVQVPPPPVLPAFFGTGIPVPSFGRGLPAGTSQNLSISIAAGSEPITYQWRLNGVDIPGANGLYYFVRNWQAANAGVYTVVATNPLGSVTSNPYTQYISPEGGWQWRNPLVTGNGLTRAAYLNGRFLVGGLRGTLLVSTDGLNWETRTVPASNNIYGFHYVNGLYVALASLGAVFTSPDTVIWTPRNTGTLHQDSSSGLQSVAYSGSRLMAVGIGGIITTSTDGINWTPGSTQTGDDLNGVAFAFGRFHAVSNTNGRIYSSEDGAVWTSVPSSANSLRSIAFGAGRLVAVGAGGVISTSLDGLTWTAVNSGNSNSFLGVDYVNGRFVIAGTNGTILTSTTGTTWSPAYTGGNTSYLQNTAYGYGIYITPGQSGTSGRSLLTSTDGVTWTERIVGVGSVGTSLRGIATNGFSLVAVGSAGTILHTTSGTLWAPRNSSTSSQLNDVNYGSGLFVTVGNSGAAASSSNGLAWVQQNFSTATLNGVKNDNGLWVVVGASGSSGRIYTSSTGTSGWTLRYSGGTSALNKSSYANGVYVAVGDAGAVVTSSNGTSWNAASSGTSSNLNDVTYGGGSLVAVGAGVVLTSPDGTTWTNRSFTPDTLTSVIYAGGYFIATGPGSTYYVSADGTNWSGRFTGAFDPVYDLALFDNQVFTVGDNSCILSAGIPVVGMSDTRGATAGSTVTLSASVSASPFPVTYQWKHNGISVAGANSPILTLVGAQTADAGSYTLLTTNALGSIESIATTLSVTSTSYLANLSVRAAMAASQTLIVGFVVDGGAKPVLVRAAGPVLNNYGLTGVVDPNLTLYNGGTVVAANNDWDFSLASTFATLGAFAFGTGSKDAALLQSINGPHTAQATATGAGAILVEAYDAGPNDGRKLVNLSTRFQVGTGDNILIAGFVLAGTGDKQVLIRAVGPTLASYGVTGTLVDPQLAVYDGGNLIASNDNWSSSLTPTFDLVGAFHLLDASKDASIVVTLQAGKAYTVQVSGVGATTGEALIEIYALP